MASMSSFIGSVFINPIGMGLMGNKDKDDKKYFKSLLAE
jgi:hypothetical protein